MPSRKPAWLLDRREDVFSQTGEDGIIAALLELMPQRNRWCVEFGAWDGQHCSNTRQLIENMGYRAVLIEPDTSRYAALCSYCAGKEGVVPMQRFVGFGTEDNLDVLLRDTPVPKDFDFLSIDIDGNDYYVWEATRLYQPKIVCIEYNPTIPTSYGYVQPPDPNCNKGCSLLSLTELGKRKGYELVGALLFNAFFVRSDLYPCLEMASNAPEELRLDTHLTTHLCVGFDGEVFVVGNRTMPWHGLALEDADLQVLPRCLRKFPPRYGPLEAACFRIYKALSRPRGMLLRYLMRGHDVMRVANK